MEEDTTHKQTRVYRPGLKIPCITLAHRALDHTHGVWGHSHTVAEEERT